MKRLRLCNKSNTRYNTLHHNDNNGSLEYLRIEDNGSIFAVFTDDSEMDVSELFPQTTLDDYKDHHILETC
ncbi:MAG: hypothetical protein OEX03_04800 [Gammaproteobacteria bacterium]|nr:hypothetical protein [Gammaproteobacteria bacterium]